MSHLTLTNVSASYGKLPVLRDIDLSIEKGKIVCLIGPSGSGKSTLLRVLVGLLKPHQGSVSIAGSAVDYGSKRSLREARDKLAIVFQQYNLFQNMTALRNVTVAPTVVRRRDRAQVDTEARTLLGKVGLADKVNSYPDQLSGGQQQRVAIARALALKPEILLLDEVTAALDPELVNEVLDTIRTLAGEGMTMLIVSHEMGFVREVADTVIFMADGRIVEQGPPAEIFDRPKTDRAREFTGKILRH